MAQRFLRAWAVLLLACGSGESTGGNDAGKDTSTSDAPTFPDTGSDAQSSDADAEVDSGPPCVEGDFHLDVTNDAGTVVLTGGCGDASAPYAVVVDPCLDCLSVQVSACGPSQNIQLSALIFPSSLPVGTFSPADIKRVDADGGQCRWDTKLTIYNWPDDAGGTVKGEYAAYNAGACAGDPSLVSGHFCVQRR
jgi:hypothetical protein